MAYDLEEQETLDALKAWWDRYGTLVVTLVVAVAIAAVAWRGWQWYHANQAAQAMGYFEALESAASDNSEDSMARIRAASSTLRGEFPKSAYTARGVLIAASALAQKNDLEAAGEQLDWLIRNSSDPAFVGLARLRLAGILLEQQRYADALGQLENAPIEFAGLYADRRGDILAASGNLEGAQKAWKQAVNELADNPIVPVIQLKIDAAGA